MSEIFTLEMDNLAKWWFGTNSPKHPGVNRIMQSGNKFVAGTISRVKEMPSAFQTFDMTPTQSRFIFSQKGWSRIVGFHTRNPIHRGHEQIQLEALKATGADGLFISPVIGPKKPGDFDAEPIMLSYQTMLDFQLYPPSSVVLGCFATYPRYAGPREAVFTALCRKNMGCSHFIIGRDHTGVGDFYGPHENQVLFESIGNIGIEPVFMDNIVYSHRRSTYGPQELSEDESFIDGTTIRALLLSGRSVPHWMMREEVVDALLHYQNEGNPLFVA